MINIVLVSIVVGTDDLVLLGAIERGISMVFDYALEYSDEDIVICGDVKFNYYALIDGSVDETHVLKAIYTDYSIGNKSVVVPYNNN